MPAGSLIAGWVYHHQGSDMYALCVCLCQRAIVAAVKCVQASDATCRMQCNAEIIS